MKLLNNRGVTLIEALCALAIIAIVVAMLAGVFSLVFSNAARARVLGAFTSETNAVINIGQGSYNQDDNISLIAPGEAVFIYIQGSPFPFPVTVDYWQAAAPDGTVRTWFAPR